jgi:lipooligosaccharide transport system permease protein
MTAVAVPRAVLSRWRRPDISWLALRVWQRNRDVFLNIWKSEAIWPFVEPLLTIVVLGFGAGQFIDLRNYDSYIEFIGPAIIAVYAMWMASAEACWGAYFRMDQGVHSAIISSPASVDDVSSGEVMWASTRALISVCGNFAVCLVFGVFTSAAAILIIPLAVLPGFMFGTMSLAYASLARSVSSLNYYFAVFITPQFWLAGVFFPVNEMPGWMQVLAWFMPAFHVVELYRALASGDLQWTNLANLAWIMVVTAIFYALAITLMRRRLVK